MLPDFYNNYRRQWCGAYWQENGINVIPTIGWIYEDSFEWCLDGVPKDSLICISNVGASKTKALREGWVEGYHKVLDILTPKKILFYGKMFPEIDVPDGIEYFVAKNQNIAKKREVSDIRGTTRKD